MGLHGGSVGGNKYWESESVRLETEYGEVVLIAPCGERRFMHPEEVRSLALRLQDMAGVAERERKPNRPSPSEAGSLH